MRMKVTGPQRREDVVVDIQKDDQVYIEGRPSRVAAAMARRLRCDSPSIRARGSRVELLAVSLPPCLVFSRDST
jgi:hypothetical protein